MKLKEKFQRFWTLSGSRKGFTLVELIVVIAILAILAGVAIPVYNGYIKKAQSAADQQLLDAVNTAFAAACLEEGIAMNELDSSSADVPLVNGKVNVNAIKPDKIREEFAFYFGENVDAAFDSFRRLVFNKDKRVFVGSEDSAYSDLAQKIRDKYSDKIPVFQNSAWMTNEDLGVDKLLEKVDGLSGLGSQLSGVFADSAFQQVAADALGVDITELEDAAEKMAKENGVDVDKIYGNAAVLFAAQGIAGMDATTIDSLFADSSNLFNSIQANPDKGEAVSQAALMYGMYTVYAAQNGVTVNSNAYMALEDLTKDTNFQAYLNGDTSTGIKGDAKNDLAAYQAALQMISESKNDKDALTSVLANGFTDKNLYDAINQVLGK